MASKSPVVLGDWGTSLVRLWLCRGDAVVETATGPGIAALRADGRTPAEVLAALTGPWRQDHGRLKTLLCGMVGANIGWVDAGYVDCPATVAEIAAALVVVESGDIAIVPGLACERGLDGPDVMRGEETQIIGALGLVPLLAQGRHVLCLPGTHSKWAVVDNGRIAHFQTALTGELFAVLQAHSILLARTHVDADADGFRAGVARIAQAGPDQLIHLLFETRSRQLRNGISAPHATGFLSGLLIGAEVAAMDAGPVTLVGSPALADLYATALAMVGRQATVIDGALAVRAGLRAIDQWQREPS